MPFTVTITFTVITTETLFASGGSVRDPLRPLSPQGRKGCGFQGNREGFEEEAIRQPVVGGAGVCQAGCPRRAGDAIHPSSGDMVQPGPIRRRSVYASRKTADAVSARQPR